MKQIFLTIAFMLAMGVCLGQNIPAINNTEVESSSEYIDGNIYQKDLLLFVDMLKQTHPYYADANHCAKLDSKARKWYKECAHITDITDFKVYLEAIASSLNDGHTAISYWSTLETIFPVRIALDGDAPAIIDVVDQKHSALLGKEVKSINGKSLKRVLKLARPLVSADNEVNYENLLKEYMMITQFWGLMGMSEQTLQLSFVDGTTAVIPAINRNSLKIAQLQRGGSSRITAHQGILFDYKIFENEGICYLQFNQFADKLTHPNFPNLVRFDDFVRDMMAEIEQKQINTLVVDLQYNSGGNSTLGDVLLSWLYPYKEIKRVGVNLRVSELLYTYYPYYREFSVEGKPLKKGEVYDIWSFDQNKDNDTETQDPAKHILNYDNDKIFKGDVLFIQGKDSFSSSTLLLTIARDNGIGKIIGEVSGGKPCHYGDILYYTLPNTNTIGTVSHKYFTRPNMELADREYLVPDVCIELNDTDNDLVWQWIVENYGKR